MTSLFETPFGDFNLVRIPDKDKNLFAWNSADRYLLKHLFDLQESAEIDLHKAKILILNDAFGALTIPLAQFSPDSYSDSFVSQQAITKNAIVAELGHKISLLKSTEKLLGQYDIVLFKEVKSQAYFQDEMLTIAAHLNPGALVLGGIMAKNMQKNILKLLAKTIGTTQASLAWKKARLLFVKPEVKPEVESELKAQRVNAQSLPYNLYNQEGTRVSSYQLEEGKETIYNFPNVFSKNKLDIGTRFFMKHLPAEKDYKQIIDLGCGNGVLALKMAQRYPDASIHCVDESYMALASAKMTLRENLNSDNVELRYTAANGLTDFPPNSSDLIVCNPPFHQQYVVGDSIAWGMFQQAKKTLLSGGELWIVGNRHLGYHLKLQKIFGNYKIIATNNKFVVLKAIKITSR